MTLPDPQLDFSSSDGHRSSDPLSPLALNASRLHNVDPSETHTDLPLPQSGNGGNLARPSERRLAAADLLLALDQAMAVPVTPPLHDVDHRAVVEWANAAARDLLFRDERRRLVREVLRVLDDEWKTAERIERLRERIQSREAKQRARAEGTYWATREGGRRAQQPTHVDVDPEAWALARAAAARAGLGVGEYVGRLISEEVSTPMARPSAVDGGERASDGAGRRARQFARLAVDKSTWAKFVAQSQQANVTVARHVGLVVEQTARHGQG